MARMAQDWIEVRCTGAADAGEVLGLLSDPDVSGAWQDNGVVRLYWPGDRWTADALVSLKRALSLCGADDAAITVDRLPARDWNAQWAKSVRPLRIGTRIVIRPSWERADLKPGDVEIVLDPRQAFGTGHHATTAMLIEWLDTIVRGGERVLDVGTGSGILAMVALKLGAETALGIDDDPVAIECAREYASVNRFGSELDLRVATLATIEPQPFDLVPANLDRNTLLASARLFEPLLARGARLLVSGILPDDRADIAAAFAEAGGVVMGSKERDGWLALEILKPDSCEGGS
jgi:ribosomal protein L11 methyltransferase